MPRIRLSTIGRQRVMDKSNNERVESQGSYASSPSINMAPALIKEEGESYPGISTDSSGHICACLVDAYRSCDSLD